MIVNKTGNANVAARAKFSELSLAADGVEKPREFEFESDQVYERQLHRSTALSNVMKFIQHIAKI